MSTAFPSWEPRNLRNHHRKRLRENPGCFEDLMQISGRIMTEEKFRDRSLQAVSSAWCEFEAQKHDLAPGAYLPARACYVDDELVVAVTNIPRSWFFTCYHEHFDSRRPLHGRYPGNNVSVAQRRLRYREDLRRKTQGRFFINVRILRDVGT
jgi:hypothetical protein